MWNFRLSRLWHSVYQGAAPIDVAIPNSRPLQFALHSKPDIWISDVMRAGGILDRHVLGFMQCALHAGDLFVDVGANLGLFSVIGSDIVGPSGSVLAFEPDPDNTALLRKNLLLNTCKNVRVYEMALGASRRRGILSRSADNQGDHQISIVNDRSDVVRVRLDTMDHVVSGIRVNFVKMDTQGSEVAILKGMANILTQKPTMVFEFWPHGLERCGATTAELVDILARLDMRMWLLRPDGRQEVSPGQLKELAATTFHPQTQGHADIAVVRRTDEASIRYLLGE
jgi:FkbM family methyltransferase